MRKSAPASATAQQTTPEWKPFHRNHQKYRVFEDHAVLIAYNAAAETVQLPETADGKPVSIIASNFLKERERLRVLYFPKTVRKIRRNACCGVRNLYRAVIPEGTEFLGAQAFADCRELEQVYLPNSLQHIGEEVFAGCPRVQLLSRRGAFAERYAAENGLSWRDISEDPPFKNPLRKSEICRLLGLSFDGAEEIYPMLCFAEGAVAGSLTALLRLRHDPHEELSPEKEEKLAEEAIRCGAKRLLTTHQVGNYPCLIATEPLFESYSRIIQSVRDRYPELPVAMITGSIGKTTVTDMVYTVLAQSFPTLGETEKAQNYVYSAGIVTQQLTKEIKAYVQEMTEIHYGTPALASVMLKPRVAAVTRVGSSHLKLMGSRERIAESCLGAGAGLGPEGTLILNADDPYQKPAPAQYRILYYGVEASGADFRAENIHPGPEGITFDLMYEAKRLPIRLYCQGRFNVSNALAAFAVCHVLGLPDRDIQEGLAAFRTRGIRQNLIRGNGFSFFLDCYNASAESIDSALRTLRDMELPAGGKRIAVLGDVAQIGEEEQEYHRHIGEQAAGAGMDAVIFCGELMRLAREAYLAAGGTEAYQADSPETAAEIVRNLAGPADIVLLKGSRSMELEGVADILAGTQYRGRW